jgi:hypothetical protein
MSIQQPQIQKLVAGNAKLPIAKPLLNVSKALSTNPYEHGHHASVGNEAMLNQTQKVSKLI